MSGLFFLSLTGTKVSKRYNAVGMGFYFSKVKNAVSQLLSTSLQKPNTVIPNIPLAYGIYDKSPSTRGIQCDIAACSIKN
jgi:hypothetical protein